MGSTGHSVYEKRKKKPTDDETFGIEGAVAYKGKIGEDTGLDKPGAHKVTLKLKAQDGNSVLFQFKLSKSGDDMTIIGFKNGIPEVKCKVSVDSGKPSLDVVIANGSKSEKNNAIKMKDLFSKSTDIKEYQLAAIANKLLAQKKKKEGNN